jgi:NADH-quinone oxidoreductase subunit E
MAVTEKVRNEIEGYLRLLPEPRAAIIPALHLFQGENGYISEENTDEIAEIIGLPPMEIKEVATFLHYIYDRPMGERVIMICDSLSCALVGGDTLKAYLEDKLGIRAGETTEDGRFTLIPASCLGLCDIAPAMLIDGKAYGNLTEEKIEEILK